jgi:hypothetical protein
LSYTISQPVSDAYFIPRGLCRGLVKFLKSCRPALVIAVSIYRIAMVAIVAIYRYGPDAFRGDVLFDYSQACFNEDGR